PLALTAFFLAALAPGAGDAKQAGSKFTPEQIAFYEKQVRPILQKNCYECHVGKKHSGGLRMDSRAALLRGGDTGPAIDLKKPDESLILSAINYKDTLEMPPTGKLPKADIDTLTKWVRMGVPFTPGKEVVVKKEPKEKKITDEDRNWWAYRP